jgi:hypothetical protein
LPSKEKKMKQSIIAYEQNLPVVFDASHHGVDWLFGECDENDFVNAVSAALRRGEVLNVSDRTCYNSCLAQRKCTALLARFDELLDPSAMYLMNASSFCTSTEALLDRTFPPCVAQTIQDTCTSFVKFSSWALVCGDQMPDSRGENRRAVEAGWPLRAQLLSHLQDRLMDSCFKRSFSGGVLEYYRALARRRWRKARRHILRLAVVKYWVHRANCPGSAGHMQSLRVLQDMLV